jgi:Rod binding domain-containing protein
MDFAKLIPTEPMLPPTPLRDPGKPVPSAVEGVEGSSQDKKEETAKDFESVLLSRVMDAMKDTIGDWGFEQDATAKQVQGLFWLYLARDVAGKGGFGLWKDIYKFMVNSEKGNSIADLPGEDL